MNRSVVWSAVSERWCNSVLQLIVNAAHHKIHKPYLGPDDKTIRGSGFIVDIRKGLVVTNGHVVADALSIHARSPLVDDMLTLKLVGILRDWDLAICMLDKKGIELLSEQVAAPEILNVVFGDDLLLQRGDEVMTIGYPLGKDNVKVTVGVVSGFQFEEDVEDESVGVQHPSYIQFDAAINPGNSGGPLLNKAGEIVGINAAGYILMQNIGYAIGTRTLLSVYSKLIRCDGHPLQLPHFSLSWNPTNSMIMDKTCGHKLYQGIYVRNVLPDSVFGKLEEGDIITFIYYQDPFWVSSLAFNVTDQQSFERSPVREVVGKFDNHGKILLHGYKSEEELGDVLLNRKISLDDLRTIIPYGSVIKLDICRNGQWLRIKCHYTPSNVYRIRLHYSQFEPLPFTIVAGLTIIPLTLNYINQHSHKRELIKYVDKQYAFTPYLIITNVFPNSEAKQVGALQINDVLKEVNGISVSNIAELNNAIRKTRDVMTIKTQDNKYFIANKKQIIAEDTEIMRIYKITNYKYLLMN